MRNEGDPVPHYRVFENRKSLFRIYIVVKPIILSAAIAFLSVPLPGQGLEPSEVMERFLDAETRLRGEFEQYTYSQSVLFQELSDEGRVLGERQVEFDIYFDTSGRRQIKKTYDWGKLATIGVSQEDLDDAVARQPFALTRKTVSRYQIDYVGRELIDDLDTYVFDVEPKKMEKKKRYFQGRIYVDDKDYLIVMTSGKIVPDYRDNKFPAFETVREEIEEGIWFPTWTGADDYLRFGRRRVRVKMVITYENFQRFEVDTSIEFDTEEPVPPK